MRVAETAHALFLTASFEETDASAWSPAALDSAFLENLWEQIVGFAIPIERIDGKTKLSQNRSPIDHARVMARLDARRTVDDREMVAMMERDPRRPTE